MNFKEFCSVQSAKRLMSWAHSGQMRKKSNTLYEVHPIRVAQMGHELGFPIFAIVGLYWHDVGEDGPESIRYDMSGLQLKADEFGVSKSISKKAIKIVDILTKYPHESKDDYIKKVFDSGNQYAMIGKILDRIDNLREGYTTQSANWISKYLISTELIISCAEKAGFKNHISLKYLKLRTKTIKSSIT